MADELKKGDRVGWNNSGGKTTGKVKKKLTSPTRIKGHDRGLGGQPRDLVESAKTGAEAAHKPGALEKK